MGHVVMVNIPFDPDLDTFAGRLKLEQHGTHLVKLRKLLESARVVARPKAVYRVVRVEARGEDYVILDGTKLTSRVLSINLAKARRVFVYVATCGVEVEEWAQSMTSPLERIQAGTIASMALVAAHQAFIQHLEQVLRPGRLGEMNPGSLPDWPLHEQRSLFDLLGDPESAIGVQLLDNYFMTPAKTSSGLLFPTQDEYYNCQLCPKENCPERRSAYDPGLYDRRYRPGLKPASFTKTGRFKTKSHDAGPR